MILFDEHRPPRNSAVRIFLGRTLRRCRRVLRAWTLKQWGAGRD